MTKRYRIPEESCPPELSHSWPHGGFAIGIPGHGILKNLTFPLPGILLVLTFGISARRTEYRFPAIPSCKGSPFPRKPAESILKNLTFSDIAHDFPCFCGFPESHPEKSHLSRKGILQVLTFRPSPYQACDPAGLKQPPSH